MQIKYVLFAQAYYCPDGVECDVDPRTFTSFTIDDIGSSVFSGHLFLGLDFQTSPRTIVSLRVGIVHTAKSLQGPSITSSTESLNWITPRLSQILACSQ